MVYPSNLSAQLQERRNRLYSTGFRVYSTELKYLLQFLNSVQYTRGLLTTLDERASVDSEQWVNPSPSISKLPLPDTEEGRAKVLYDIIKLCVNDGEGYDWLKWARVFGSAQHTSDTLPLFFTEAIVDPLLNYLCDRIDDGGNVLSLIVRFKMKSEWFRQSELYGLYCGNTSVGESSLNRELRAALFDGGVDYPFTEPLSPSGQADIVALSDSEDPLVLEVKVYDPNRSKGKRHVRQGFHQIVRYASDYNQSVGYLVVFNCSDRQLAISSREASEPRFPPRIAYGDKTFFSIPININPEVDSASKENPDRRVCIYFDELTG